MPEYTPPEIEIEQPLVRKLIQVGLGPHHIQFLAAEKGFSDVNTNSKAHVFALFDFSMVQFDLFQLAQRFSHYISYELTSSHQW